MTATLLSNSVALRKAVRDALAPTKIAAKRITAKQAGRAQADAVVTTSSISSSVSWLAMRLNTPWIFVLPEATSALLDFLAARPDAVLAGNDLSKLESLVRAEAKGGEQTVIL